MQSRQAAGACLQCRLQAAGALCSQQMGHDGPLSLLGSRKDSVQPIAVCVTKRTYANGLRWTPPHIGTQCSMSFIMALHARLAATGLSLGLCCLSHLCMSSLQHELIEKVKQLPLPP